MIPQTLFCLDVLKVKLMKEYIHLTHAYHYKLRKKKKKTDQNMNTVDNNQHENETRNQCAKYNHGLY